MQAEYFVPFVVKKCNADYIFVSYFCRYVRVEDMVKAWQRLQV